MPMMQRRQLAVEPSSARAWGWLSLLSRDHQKRDLLHSWLNRAVAAGPKDSGALLLVGEVARRLEGHRQAQRCLKQFIALAPESVDGHVNLGALAGDMGAADVGKLASKRALALDPTSWLARYNIAIALRTSAPDLALAHLRAAVALHPLVVELRQLLARIEPALDRKAGLARPALVLAPADADTLTGLGASELVLSQADAASRAYSRAAAVAPGDLGLASAALLSLSYSGSASPGRLVAAHRAFGRRFPTPPRPERRQRLQGDPIRVGFVSGDFRWHSTAFLLPPLLLNRDPARWRAHLYSNVEKPDEMTSRFHQMSDAWTDISILDDAAAERAIRSDGIDVLIDLNGHTRGHRLSLFMRRCAPVQATWLDYPGSTGLPQIDYAITDAYHSPPGTEGDYVETVIRLPGNRFCYEPPLYAPAVGPLPAAKSGRVTFGCFNALYKIGPGPVRAWAQILAAVAGSRLLLVGAPAATEGIKERFKQHGIDADRIDVMPSATHETLLGRYADIDVALDTFPYSGGLTTCEALWMGVPVVTFVGDRVAGRHSTAHLHTVGLDDMVAADVDSYVTRATSLTGDLAALAALRHGLRGRVAKSPLVDGPGFARAFADMLQAIV